MNHKIFMLRVFGAIKSIDMCELTIEYLNVLV